MDTSARYILKCIITSVHGEDSLFMDLNSPIDTDGCGWTFDKDSEESKLITSYGGIVDIGVSWQCIKAQGGMLVIQTRSAKR